MKITRLLTVALAAGTLLFGASAVATSTPANAHTPEASATCSTLTVDLQNYSVGTNGAFVNSITVEIDSTVVDEADFGSSLDETYPLGDTAVAHDYLVEIDASGTQYDRDFSGTSVPCIAQVAPDAAAALSTTPATCDSNGALVLGDVDNAAWGTPTAVSGPSPYSVVAIAASGHTFPDGATSKTFTGLLEGELDAGVPQCASLVIPDRPLPVQELVDETSVDCGSVTQTTTTTTTTTDWMLDAATNSWVTAPAVVTTASATVAVAPAACASVVTPPRSSHRPRS